jgi:hypothetical protein
VQHYANVVLDYLSRMEKNNEELRELKLALVTARILEPFDAFPEIRPDDEEQDEAELPKDTEQVKYIFSETSEDAQSIEEELRNLLASAAEGTASFSDSEDDWL